MERINFSDLEEVFECYGRENLIPIDFIKQIIFYTSHGCQPRFVWHKEDDPTKITCWFLKSETSYVYKKWQEQKPKK